MYLVIQYGPKLMYITETKQQAEHAIENYNQDLINLILIENPNISKKDTFSINQLIRDNYDELYISEIDINNIKKDQDFKTSEGEVIDYKTLATFLDSSLDIRTLKWNK